MFHAASHRGGSGQVAAVEPGTASIYYDLDRAAPSESSWSTDSEYWARENLEDPWPEEKLQAERQSAEADPLYMAHVFWTKRVADRRWRAAKGRFHPRRHRRGRKTVARRLTRRGPTGGGSKKARKGFFIGEAFVSLDHVPEEALQAFFNKKRPGKRGMPKDLRCFNCGKPGHMARECPEETRKGG